MSIYESSGRNAPDLQAGNMYGNTATDIEYVGCSLLLCRFTAFYKRFVTNINGSFSDLKKTDITKRHVKKRVRHQNESIVN